MLRLIVRDVPRRIGIFGGSFDPPHLCHVLACAFTLSTSEVDEVWVLPTYRHPFAKVMAPFVHRVRMVRLAVAPLGRRVKVSTMERSAGARGFTYDTLCALRKRYPGHSLRLVVGSDILAERHRWYRFPDVERMAPLLVVPRLPSARGADRRVALPPVSSTLVRKLLDAGRDPGPLVPAAVRRYVVENRLYGPGSAASIPKPK